LVKNLLRGSSRRADIYEMESAPAASAFLSSSA
jgi:hypothetical protein